MEGKKHEGIAALASLILCIGAWNILVQIYGMRFLPQVTAQMLQRSPAAFRDIVYLAKRFEIPAFLFSIFYCISAYYLIKLKKWARISIIALSLISAIIPMILQLNLLFKYGTLRWETTLPSGITVLYSLGFTHIPYIIFMLFIIVYLNLPRVKEFFK